MKNETSYLSLTDGQNKLLDYWKTHQLPCGCAPRAAINPGQVRELLANISIVELSRSGHATFRLAGSLLRDIVGAEARGRSVSEIQGGDLEPWCDALLTLLDTRMPVSGVNVMENGMGHVWLRLPLLDSSGELTQILCHDELVGDEHKPLKTRAKSELIPHLRERYAA